MSLKVLQSINWLQGRLELYKIKFSETNNNNYLNTMNNYNELLNVMRALRDRNRALQLENDKLKNGI